MFIFHMLSDYVKVIVNEKIVINHETYNLITVYPDFFESFSKAWVSEKKD